MRSNFSVRLHFKSIRKNFDSFNVVTHAKFSPRQTVPDERVIGHKFQRFLNQRFGFWKANIAVCKRVTQSVVSVVGIRLDRYNAAQQALHFRQLAQFFSHHGLVVHQV